MVNQAAWLPEAKSQLQVGPAEDCKAGPQEIIVKAAAVAVNQIDWKIQTLGLIVKSYPNVLGTAVAGEVADVGAGVSRFQKGDRVMGHCIGLGTDVPKQGGFQLLSVLPELTVAPIPHDLSYAQAAVLPLPISTAAAGLYQEDFLALPFPKTDKQPQSKSILVWGGSSSVGSAAIQLASASGFMVVTTASEKNRTFVESLGAKQVFDYNDLDLISEILDALKATEFSGAIDTISKPPTISACAEVVQRSNGSKKLVTMIPPPQDLPRGVDAKGVFALSIALKERHIARAIYTDYIPFALQSGQFQAKPDPLIIEGGLGAIQQGLDRAKQGTSAAKVVVTI